MKEKNLIETKIKITCKDDVNTLYQKFSNNSYKSIVELLKKLEKDELKLKKQKKTNKKAYTILSEDECRINWKKSGDEIYNKIRALKFPYPQAFSALNRKKYFFNNAEMTNKASRDKSGIIEKINDAKLYVSSKDKMIKLSEVYSGDKKINLTKEFKAGDTFI